MIDKWTIYWEELNSTYLYGSRIRTIDREHVIFQNPLMPPSAVIVTWYSKTIFYKHRIEPALPIISEGARYKISAKYTTKGKGSCLMRLIFFNRLDEKIDELNMRDVDGEFVCPQGTYSYQLEIVNGGIDTLTFESITIWEVEDEAKI